MRTASIRIEPDTDAVMERFGFEFIEAWNTGHSDTDTFSFATAAQLFSLLTLARWTLIEQLQGLGPTAVSTLASALGRDLGSVEQDVAALVDFGLVDYAEDGRVEVPYAVIHADFELRAAA